MALLALLLASNSIAYALAVVVVKVDPKRAYQLAPGDGRVTAALADELFGANPIADGNSEPARLARLALRQDPTAVDALSVLGLQGQLRNDPRAALGTFAYSQALSRRELRPQMWAIEEAVSRGDIQAALVQYDIAMRTSARARDMLYPALAAAISEPKVSAELIKLVEANPDWVDGFLRFLSSTAPDVQATIKFISDPGMRSVAKDAYRVGLVHTLVAQGRYQEAWNYYRSTHPNVDHRTSRDPRFTADSARASPFDWISVNAPGIATAIHTGDGQGAAEFSVAPSTSGVLLHQLQMLPPGRYEIQGKSSGIDQPERSRPYWTLSCDNGVELGRVPLPNSSVASGAFAGFFTVPANCPVQTLALNARPSDSIQGVVGRIVEAQLRKEPR